MEAAGRALGKQAVGHSSFWWAAARGFCLQKECYTKEVLTRKVGYDEKGKNLKKSQASALQFVEKFLAVAAGIFLLRRCIHCNCF